jgi:phosphonopyruvate decarboxylase
MMDLEDCLKTLNKYRTDEVVVCTMTQNQYWPFMSNSRADVLLTDPMGSASSLALGIALARPDVRVWLFNGDGSLLMYLGSLVTLADTNPSNLVQFLFNNKMYGRPAVPLPNTSKTDFCALARGAGIENVFRFNQLEELDANMPHIKSTQGPLFVDLEVAWQDTIDPAYGQRSADPEAVERYGGNGLRNIKDLLSSRK